MSGAARKATGTAWQTTAQLRDQFIRTTIDATPARFAEASAEWKELRAKIVSRDFTINDTGIAALRALEIYGFYRIGRAIGSRSIST